MPEFQKEGAAPGYEQTYYPHYFFTEDHRLGWQQFWASVDGDLVKCKKFAESGKIDDPDQWCASLHKFLFSVWPGDPTLLMKEAQQKSLQNYVAFLAKTHLDKPSECSFYRGLGVTSDDYVRIMKEASEFEDEQDILRYISARIPAYGDRVIEEYMLQFGGFEKVSAYISRLREVARRIRIEATKLDLNFEIKASEVV